MCDKKLMNVEEPQGNKNISEISAILKRKHIKLLNS